MLALEFFLQDYLELLKHFFPVRAIEALVNPEESSAYLRSVGLALRPSGKSSGLNPNSRSSLSSFVLII